MRQSRLLLVRAVLCLAACGVSAAQSTITGRLLQKRGDAVIPLSECTVFARSIDNGPLVGEYPDAQGRFKLDFPADSRVTVGTICPGFQILEINGRRTVPPTHDCSTPGPCADVQLTLEPLAAVEGFVVDHNGMPVEQINLEVRQVRGGPRAWRGQAVSDDRGYFRLYHLAPGEYELEPVIHGGQHMGFTWEGDTQRLTVGVGDVLSAVQVRLRPVAPLELRGRISGLPPGITSVSLSLKGSDRTAFSMSTSVQVDAEGRFWMSDLPPGKYQLQVKLSDETGATLAESSAYLGTVDLGPSSEELVFSRSEPGRIAGTVDVVWPDRDDLPGPSKEDALFFRLISEEGFGQHVFAQPPGYGFQLDNVNPGTYKLVFDARGANVTRRGPGGEGKPIEPIIVRSGQTTELELQVTFEVGRLTVWVKPVPGSEEAAQNKPAAYYVVGIRQDGRTALYPTDQNGRLLLRYFERGDYEVCAWRALSPQQADEAGTWREAGEAVRKFRHEGAVDMEITLTAAP